MTILVFDQGKLHIPLGIDDLASFRRWVRSDEFPKEGRICFLQGEVWVDMSREQFYSHNQVKTEFTRVISTLVKSERLGPWCSDGMRLSNPNAELSCVPDGFFFYHQSLDSGRIRPIEGAEGGCVEFEGTPDMALEVVSDSSEKKDSQMLHERYWKAGITEYWIVDARDDRLEFEVFKHGPKGYIGTRKQSGWAKSKVFGKSFRLMRQHDQRGNSEYTLEVR